jgi:stage V sporulation protein R
MPASLAEHTARLEELARQLGLDYDPVDFELVPPAFMMEVAIYGLPVRMPHWSFGLRYIHQLVQHRMGQSRIFEVLFPGNPGHAYLAETNTLTENTLVVAHVLGHADFSKNNALFRRCQEQVGHRVVEQAAERAHRIEQAIEAHGQERVEAVLDAALALEHQVDVDQAIARPPYAWCARAPTRAAPDAFRSRFDRLTGDTTPGKPAAVDARTAPRCPPRPEHDLLWFIARYAPELEEWARDILLAVREESFYFYPVYACTIMNEGWASYWHARLLREARFLPGEVYVDALKTHSDVVRPVAGEHEVALTLNPYHLGFTLWDRIVEARGLEAARAIRREEDDFGFVRNYLDEALADDLGLFTFEARSSGEVRVRDRDLHRLQEAILAPRFNFGAPRVAVSELQADGTLVLRHDHTTDGRGLDLDRARKVLGYIHRLWRRPVRLHTVDDRAAEVALAFPL